MDPLRQVHGGPRGHQPVHHPDPQQDHQRGARRAGPGRHRQPQPHERAEVGQVDAGQDRAPGQGRRRRTSAADHERGRADHRRRHQQQRERARDAEGLAHGQLAPADAGGQKLAQRALLPLAGERAERQQDDEQGHEVLQDLRRGQGPHALRARRVLGRAHEEVVLPVGLQPHRRARVGVHALVDERQGEAGLERVDAVVGGRVGILLALRLPVVAGGGLRGRELLLRLARLDPAVSQRDQEQRPHQGRAPAETAVPDHVGELLPRDVLDHR